MGRWYYVMVLCDDVRIGKVIEFAEAKLDLAGIATGAADELGLGRGFEQHSCLDYILYGGMIVAAEFALGIDLRGSVPGEPGT